MKNFINKVDNDPTAAGVVDATDYNSCFSEIKGAVSPFLTLDAAVTNQLVKSIDIASKAMFYWDTGTVNNVTLNRPGTTAQIETLVDGMVVFFSPSNTNTGPVMLRFPNIPAKPIYFKGTPLSPGTMIKNSKYIATYRAEGTPHWDADILTTGGLHYSKAEVDALAEKVIPVGSILKMGGGANTLDGYFLCAGASVSKAAFPELFAVLGSIYGAPTATQFKLPDWRGYFLRGQSNTRNMGEVEEDMFKSHSHTRTSDNTQVISKGTDGKGRVNWDQNDDGHELDFGTQITGSTGGVETRPKNYPVKIFIKY
ncbi:MAG: tail fiber protein [Candidatus Methanofishera endochildressiae]|uniref:Tail fiber protein n=1 Tax=Candidatus Methanofishera endochildressiae TaxID=2738884 RepID=A0A7Z0MMT2_9GAMM|nr:tail fiber protein [Candidatus Methanofishera endochildressiae]